MEKENMRRVGSRLLLCGCVIGALAATGCRTSRQSEYVDIPELPGTPLGIPANAGGSANVGASRAPTAAEAPSPVAATPAPAEQSKPAEAQLVSTAPRTKPAPAEPTGFNQDTIRVGEVLDIAYSDAANALPAHEKVRDDGTITLMFNQRFQAVGKTARQLEAEIREAYVPDYFKQLTVSVTRPEIRRFIYIDGEVKAASKQEYTGPITLSQVIAACGGFTDFANRRGIELIRANGKKEKFDYKKILKDPRLDPEVNPGDRILVHRSIF